VRLAILALSVSCATALAQSPDFEVGPVAFHPSGFFDFINEFRSQTSSDTINTRYAALPLTDSPGEWLNSPAHSRLALHSEAPVENARVVVYLEADFLQPHGYAPWRWRQYWLEVRLGRWRLMGGHAWSLFRPNRRGITSEIDLMNTLVIEPAYHVGIAGVRRKSLRVTRDVGKASAIAFEWATHGEFVAKFATETKRSHFEAIGGVGTNGRYGFSLAQTQRVGRWLDVVGQQMWSRGFGPELLGILPPRVRTASVLEGLEAHPAKRTTVFGYGGLVYGTRSNGNRLARQWTAGAYQRLYERKPSAFQLGLQVSQVDRSVWDGRQGFMWYTMASARWTVGGH
jgi:hypothetical protein